MPTLQIRIDESSLAKIKERGGSPWAREILYEALAEPEPQVMLEPAEGVKVDPQEPSGRLTEELADQTAIIHEGLCPRWMHHREGVFCKVCGELQ